MRFGPETFRTISRALGTKITGSPQWKQLPALLRSVAVHPSLDEVRLARALADTELEARFKTVFDDPLLRLDLERTRAMMPSAEAGQEDLEYLEKR